MRLSEMIYGRFHRQVASLADGNSIRGRLARGLFWSLVSTGLSQLASMGMAIVSARILGAREFGELTAIRSTILLIGVLAGTGMGVAATKLLAENRGSNPSACGRYLYFGRRFVVLLASIAALILAASAPYVAAHALNAPQLSTAVAIGAIVVLANALSAAQNGVLAGFEAYKDLARCTVVESIVTAVLYCLGSYCGGVEGAIAGLAAGGAVGVLLREAAVGSHQPRMAPYPPKSARMGYSEVHAVLSIALPASMISLTAQPVEWLVAVLLARQPNGFAELGIFRAASAWGLVALLIPMQIAAPTRPLLANLFGAGDTRTSRRVVRFNSVLCLASAATIGVPMFLFRDHLMRVFGHTFATGASTLGPVLASNLIASWTLIGTEVMTATGRLWLQYALRISWALSTIVFAWFLEDRGAIGIAFAYMYGNLVYLLLQHAVTSRLLAKRFA